MIFHAGIRIGITVKEPEDSNPYIITRKAEEKYTNLNPVKSDIYGLGAQALPKDKTGSD